MMTLLLQEQDCAPPKLQSPSHNNVYIVVHSTALLCGRRPWAHALAKSLQTEARSTGGQKKARAQDERKRRQRGGCHETQVWTAGIDSDVPSRGHGARRQSSRVLTLESSLALETNSTENKIIIVNSRSTESLEDKWFLQLVPAGGEEHTLEGGCSRRRGWIRGGAT
jgi:hypothetical protein